MGELQSGTLDMCKPIPYNETLMKMMWYLAIFLKWQIHSHMHHLQFILL